MEKIVEALAIIKASRETIKKLFTINKSLKDIGLKKAIIEMNENNLDLREHITALKEELTDKESEIERLKSFNQHMEDLIFDKNVYWYKDDKTKCFCTRCMHKDKIIMPLTNCISYWECPECKSQYPNLDYEQPFPVAIG